MSENKDFEMIMKEITGGLTGDAEADLVYLTEQGDKYKDHEYGKEILRACGRLMYELIPDDKKEKLDESLAKDNLGFDAALDEAKFNIYKKNYNKALKLLEEMIDKYGNTGLFEDDAVSEYHCFSEPMEEILYRRYTQPEKDIRMAGINFAALYHNYGSLLVELNRLDEAADALFTAMRWNPAYTGIAFEYAETFKMRGLLEAFKDFSKNIFKYAYRPEDLARCYRNMSFYYVEKQDYETAACCLIFSKHFSDSEMAASELYYIGQVTGQLYKPTLEEIEEHFEEHDIPLGPDKEVLGIAYSYGRHLYEQGEMQGAVYFLEIFTDFIQDEEVVKMCEDARAKAGVENKNGVFDELKMLSDAGFREIYQKFIYVHCRDLLCEMLPDEIGDDITGVIGYCYIDRTEGLSIRPVMIAALKPTSLQVFTMPHIEDTLYILRFRDGYGKPHELHDGDSHMYLYPFNPKEHQFLNLSVVNFNTDDFYEIKEEIDENYSAGEGVEELRSEKFDYLDRYRHEWYPDDVQVNLYKKGIGIEQVWVRLAFITADGEIFGELLNEPNNDFGCHLGSLIEITEANVPEDGKALFFTGRTAMRINEVEDE